MRRRFRPPTATPTQAVALLLLSIFVAATPAFGQSDPLEDGKIVEADQEVEAPEESEPAAPPEIRATLFLRAGSGGAENRLKLSWNGESDDRPLHDTALIGVGGASTFGIGVWFYPTEAEGLIVSAGLYTAGTSALIHFAGDGYEQVDKKRLEVGGIDVVGGLAYRLWVGQSQRYFWLFYTEAGPGGASMKLDGYFDDPVGLIGGMFAGGFGFGYHYSTRLMLAGTFDVGMRGYLAQDVEVENEWVESPEEIDISLYAGFARFALLFGYEF
jgi:hypothetical protein